MIPYMDNMCKKCLSLLAVSLTPFRLYDRKDMGFSDRLFQYRH